MFCDLLLRNLMDREMIESCNFLHIRNFPILGTVISERSVWTEQFLRFQEILYTKYSIKIRDMSIIFTKNFIHFFQSNFQNEETITKEI